MTTETTKYPDMTQMDPAVMEMEWMRKEGASLPSGVVAFAREYARQMVAADREKRASELTDAMLAQAIRDHHFIASDVDDERVIAEQPRLAPFARRIFALARPSDASAVRDDAIEDAVHLLTVAWSEKMAAADGPLADMKVENAERYRRAADALRGKRRVGRDEERVKREAAREALTKLAEAIAKGGVASGSWTMSATPGEIRAYADRTYPLPSPRCVLSTGEVWEKGPPERSVNGVCYLRRTNEGEFIVSSGILNQRIGELSVAGLTEDVTNLVAFAKEGK